MAKTILNLKSETPERQEREHEAIHALHKILKPDQLIALADYARKNPEKVGKIINAIESGSTSQMLRLVPSLF